MINVREKFNSIIDINKEWQYILVRHLTDQRCLCVNQPPMILNETLKAYVPNPSFRTVPDPDCGICGGTGYIYEEFIHKAMIFYPSFRIAHFEEMQFAATEQNVLTVHLKPTEETNLIKVNDVLFDIACELNGAIKHPIARMKKWITIDKQSIRLDRNKLEYIKLFAKPAIL